jgi:hypothetical protein
MGFFLSTFNNTKFLSPRYLLETHYQGLEHTLEKGTIKFQQVNLTEFVLRVKICEHIQSRIT